MLDRAICSIYGAKALMKSSRPELLIASSSRVVNDGTLRWSAKAKEPSKVCKLKGFWINKEVKEKVYSRETCLFDKHYLIGAHRLAIFTTPFP